MPAEWGGGTRRGGEYGRFGGWLSERSRWRVGRYRVFESAGLYALIYVPTPAAGSSAGR